MVFADIIKVFPQRGYPRNKLLDCSPCSGLKKLVKLKDSSNQTLQQVENWCICYNSNTAE